jgi:hypothetical protein
MIIHPFWLFSHFWSSILHFLVHQTLRLKRQLYELTKDNFRSHYSGNGAQIHPWYVLNQNLSNFYFKLPQLTFEAFVEKTNRSNGFIHSQGTEKSKQNPFSLLIRVLLTQICYL